MLCGHSLRLLGILVLFTVVTQAFIPIRTVEEYKTTVLMSKRPVLVFFSSSWCGESCDKLKQIVEKEGRYHPNVILAHMDLDEMDMIARLNMVSNVPALVLFKNGRKVKMQMKYIDEYDVKYFFAWAI